MSIIEENKIKIVTEIPKPVFDFNCYNLALLREFMSNIIINFFQEDPIFYQDDENNLVYLDESNFDNLLELDRISLVVYNHEKHILDNCNEGCNDTVTFVLEMTNFKNSTQINKKSLKQRLKSTEELLDKKEKLINFYKTEQKLTDVQQSCSLNEKREFLKVSQELEKLKSDYNALAKLKLLEFNKDEKICSNPFPKQGVNEINSTKVTHLKNDEFQSNYSIINYSSYCGPNNEPNNNEVESDSFESLLEKVRLICLKNEEVKSSFYFLLEKFHKCLYFMNKESVLKNSNIKESELVYTKSQYFCVICEKMFLTTNKKPRILNCRHYICETDELTGHQCD